jgi:hypothetical protein
MTAVHYQFGFGYGTAVQIAAYNPPASCPYEPVFDTTNQRIVVMLGTGAGDKVAMASEPYVQAQIASIAAGNAFAFLTWLTCV